MNKKIDNLIRDITKAGFMPKSEARRRINEILKAKDNQHKKDREFLTKTFDNKTDDLLKAKDKECKERLLVLGKSMKIKANK